MINDTKTLELFGYTSNKLLKGSHINHIKTNFKRSFWNKLFTYALEYDKEYYNDNKINIWEMI